MRSLRTEGSRTVPGRIEELGPCRGERRLGVWQELLLSWEPGAPANTEAASLEAACWAQGTEVLSE